MRKEEIVIYLNKKVRINLSNSYNYTGVIVSVDDENTRIIDKFKNPVSLMNHYIVSIAIVGDDQ